MSPHRSPFSMVALGLLMTLGACDSGEAKPKAADAKAKQAKVAATPKAVDAKAVDAKAVDAKAADAKAVDAKAADAKAVDAKAADADAKAADPAKAGPTSPVLVDNELSLEHEGIGELRQGMTTEQVVALLGEPDKRSKIEEEGATGDFVLDWEYAAKGLSIGMAGATAKGPFSVSSMTANAKCTLSASWGLKIGSTRAEVEKVYGKAFDADFTNDQSFVAGSVYGGVFFDFQDGKVTGIFIGAGAE